MQTLQIAEQPVLPQDTVTIEEENAAEQQALSSPVAASEPLEEGEFSGEELAEIASIGIMGLSGTMARLRGEHWLVDENALSRFEKKLARYLSTTSMADLPAGWACLLSAGALFTPAIMGELAGMAELPEPNGETIEHEQGVSDDANAATA